MGGIAGGDTWQGQGGDGFAQQKRKTARRVEAEEWEPEEEEEEEDSADDMGALMPKHNQCSIGLTTSPLSSTLQHSPHLRLLPLLTSGATLALRASPQTQTYLPSLASLRVT